MNRRQFLMTSGLFAAGGLSGLGMASRAQASPVTLTIQSARFALEANPTEGMVSLSPDAPPPVLRLRQGQPFVADVTNTLDDYTAMHWHGLRLPNAMDGVPYLTQIPMGQGDTYRYEFTPPDAGTYWYHPHCNTMAQMARGLTGVLIVDEAEDPGFDLDLPVNLRDWRLGEGSQFIDLFTARGAARGGTHGTVMTANWAQEPVYDAPAGGLVRLRLVATDTTRVYRLHLPGAEGQVIALDGHPLLVPVAFPTAEAPLILGPGQRADLAIRMPASEGQTLTLFNDQPGGLRTLLTLRATGPDSRHALADLRPLAPNPLPLPDLANAEVLEFVFGWSPGDGAVNNGFCGSLGYTFWSINRVSWPGDAADGGPLATLERGRTYILRLRNESPNDHPIHLHGLAFLPLRSDRREIASNWVDTAMLLERETMDVALVADNPGDWAFHCHVIEHQKTGLTGFLRIP
ncbi:multicopper oxidase family protein [Pararhodobacter zhoushanensis]|uniref:Multicopper oxidase family protein n=1 Tax=Pararhodobacter zhoushanensis TaxID=2479545 RepID=A0ABT3GVM6_9RHOB|nr:multicopper oxidase family protein [Pararhodobacter zhoushanensis]MCW1931569.1 multicopper oxidase family protein [Pararhodobacter zhoushanensis]